MNVLHVSAECFPFIKIGGLADVVGTLPQELKKLRGVDCRVMMPKYKTIPEKYRQNMVHLTDFSIELGDKKNVYVGIDTLKLGSIIYYFVDNHYSFGSRDQVYNYGDECERFAYFQKAAIESLHHIDFMPDIIHVHDWHTAMIPLLLKTKYQEDFSIKTVLSIHNLAYQGIFPIREYHLFNMEYDGRFEFEGFLNFLKSGIVSSDYVTTVSKTYAEEMMTDYFGYGLQKLIKSRRDSVIGIVNGISEKEFNPKTDQYLKQKYDLETVKTGKRANKKALFDFLKVDFDLDLPVISIVSRLVSQKGIDLIKRVFEELLHFEKFTFIVLGDGEKEYMDYFTYLQTQFPNRVKCYLGYHNELAHLVYAGSDLFLMPSKFEPCGLGQMIALKYGTLPIVRETGGLKDTVIPYNEYNSTGNGFSFTHYNAHDMMHVIRYALKQYHQNPDGWMQLIENAMTSDNSWKTSATKYKSIYKTLNRKKKG